MDVILRLPRETLRQFITCYICDGVLIDATALPECSHEFCRSCIVKHCLRPGPTLCPVEGCGAEIHTTKPLAKIKNDTTLQTLVFKLFPDVYKDEMDKRREFYKKNPESRSFFNETLREATQEDLGVLQNVDWLPRPVPKTVFVALQYLSVVSDNAKISEGLRRKDKIIKAQGCFRFCLQSDSAVGELKKLAALKFHLQPNHMVVFLLTNIILEDSYTLADVIRFFSCKQLASMVLDFVLADVDSFTDDVCMEAAIVRTVRKRPVSAPPLILALSILSTSSEPQPSTSQSQDQWFDFPEVLPLEDLQPGQKRRRRKKNVDPLLNSQPASNGREYQFGKRRKRRVTFEAPLPGSIDSDPMFRAVKRTTSSHVETEGEPSKPPVSGRLREKRTEPLFFAVEGTDSSPQKTAKKQKKPGRPSKNANVAVKREELLGDELITPYQVERNNGVTQPNLDSTDPAFQQYLKQCFNEMAQIDNGAVSEMRYLELIRHIDVERLKPAINGMGMDRERKKPVKRKRKATAASGEGTAKKKRVRKAKVASKEAKCGMMADGESKSERMLSSTQEIVLSDHTYAKVALNETTDDAEGLKTKPLGGTVSSVAEKGSVVIRPQNPVVSMSMNVQYTNGIPTSNGQPQQQLYLVPASQSNNQSGNVFVLNMDQLSPFASPRSCGSQNSMSNGGSFSVPIITPVTSPNNASTKYGQQRNIAPKPTIVQISPLGGIGIINGPITPKYGGKPKKRNRKQSTAATDALRLILEGAAGTSVFSTDSRENSSNRTSKSSTPISAPLTTASTPSSVSSPTKEISDDGSRMNLMWPVENEHLPTLRSYSSDEEAEKTEKSVNGLEESHLADIITLDD